MTLWAPLLLCLWIPYGCPQQGTQHHPTYTGGSQPKVPTNHLLVNPSPNPNQGQKRVSDPVNHPCRWIHKEMERTRHPCCWKEIKSSGRVSIGSQIIREGISNSEALHYAWWQVVAFRLPATQHDASGWWDVPSWLSRLCPNEFMLHSDTFGPKDYQANRKEKTLALAQALQVCAKGSGAPTGVLCHLAWELQNTWAPWWP